jgi:antitoxin component YwqK of YwqJK toxin-antitoxin module
MHHLPLSRLLIGKTVPLTVVAIGIATNAFAIDQTQLKMPQTFAATEDAASGEPAQLHTDLGVMGEVELIRERYPDGAIRIERQVTLDRDGNYVNHGAWKMFSPKGDVLSEGQFHFGRRVGLWTRWHGRNDSPIFNEFPFNQFKAPYMSQANFTDGAMDGEWILTDANDRKINQISLKAGQRHGMAITWLANGKIYRQATYDHAVPTGDLLEANKRTGELDRVATFVDGRRIITHTTHYPGNRQKHTETMYLAAATIEQSADDFWNLRMAKYTTDGNDLRHGLAKAWYPNGKIEQEGIYQFGEKAGAFTYWHENGQVAATGEFRNDQPEGTWVWWHENGQKLAVGQYQAGVLMGEWRWWSEAGKLTKQHTYDGSETVTSQSDGPLDVSLLIDEEENSIF